MISIISEWKVEKRTKESGEKKLLVNRLGRRKRFNIGPFSTILDFKRLKQSTFLFFSHFLQY
jgi:hypothetical protein